MNYNKCLTQAPGAQCSNHRETEPQLLLLFLFHLASGWLSQSESRSLVFKGSNYEPTYSASGWAASCAQTLRCSIVRAESPAMPEFPDTEFLSSLFGVSRNVNSRYQTCDLNSGLYEELSITLS